MYDVMKAEPFQPFAVYYPSGRRFVVSSRDQAVISGDKRTLVLARDPRSQEGSGIDMIDVAMAEQIEILSDPPKDRMWWVSPNGH
ncbi:MAG: hypothetical protein AAFX76_06000 [Planctomycetota bacterium]